MQIIQNGINNSNNSNNGDNSSNNQSEENKLKNYFRTCMVRQR